MNIIGKQRVIFFFLGLLLLLSFYLFSREVKREFLKQTDFDVTVRLQDKIPARFDAMWEDIAFFVTPVPSVVLIGILTLVAFINIKQKKIHIGALLIPLAFAGLIAGEIYGKFVVHHPAPPFFLLKNPTTIFPTYHVQEQFSYPSGHAARAVFLAIVVWFSTIQPASPAGRQFNNITMKKQLWLLSALGVYVCFVSIGRIYLGHHWLSDVLGGGMLGLGFGLLGLTFLMPQANSARKF